MFTLPAVSTFSETIRKSRFLAVAGPISDEAEAKAFIAHHSHVDANHNCWAWRVGQVYRFNDDGEPGGTAGKPILQAIDGQGLDRVAVVVTRWFGGILLGSGGLIRAYGGTAAQCLRTAEKAPVIAMRTLEIECDFSSLAALKARVHAVPHAVIENETFTETGADITARVPSESIVTLQDTLISLMRGRGRVHVG